jgi:hypothetical protein
MSDQTVLERATDALDYNMEDEEFSDGSWLDWFVYEPCETAHVVRGSRSTPVRARHLNAPAHWPGTLWTPGVDELSSVSIRIPVNRFGDETRTLRLPAVPVPSIGKIMEAVRAFYARPLCLKDVALLVREDPAGDAYRQDVVARLATGARATWLELIGAVRDPGDSGPGTEPERRHPLSCSGLVRYEGFKVVEHGVLRLVLGS